MKHMILFLSLCLILSVPIGATEIQVGTANGLTGDTISVPVSIQGNPGFAGFHLQIRYDRSLLELTDIQKGTLLQPATSANLNKDLTTGRVQWIYTENLTGDGTFLTLHFNMLEHTQYKTTPVSVSLVGGNAKNLTNVDLEAIPCTITGGSVVCRTGELLVKDWALNEQDGSLICTLLDAPKEPVRVITATYSKAGQLKTVSSTQRVLAPGVVTLPAGEMVKVFFLHPENRKPLSRMLCYVSP